MAAGSLALLIWILAGLPSNQVLWRGPVAGPYMARYVLRSVKMIRFSYSNEDIKDKEKREGWWPQGEP